MDWVIPGSVDMSKVKFDAQDEDDCKYNFSLLHEAFSKNGITKVCSFSLVEKHYNFFFYFVLRYLNARLRVSYLSMSVIIIIDVIYPSITRDNFTYRAYASVFACVSDCVLLTIRKYAAGGYIVMAT